MQPAQRASIARCMARAWRRLMLDAVNTSLGSTAAASAAAAATAAGTVLTAAMSAMLDFQRHCRCHAVDGTETVYDTKIIASRKWYCCRRPIISKE